MLKEILILAIICIIPLIELRLAIPVGILSGTIILPFGISLSGFSMPPLLVFLIAVIISTLFAIFLFNLLHYTDSFFRKSHANSLYSKTTNKYRKRVKKYVDKYGLFGLILFISIPIPGIGVYAGTTGAFMIGMKKEEVYFANMIGIIISALIVLSLALIGNNVLRP